MQSPNNSSIPQMSFTTRIKVLGSHKKKKESTKMTQSPNLKMSPANVENPTPENYVEIDGIKFKITESEEDEEDIESDSDSSHENDEHEEDDFSIASSSQDLSQARPKKGKISQDAVKKKTHHKSKKEQQQQPHLQLLQESNIHEKPKDDSSTALFKVNKRKVCLGKFSLNTPLYPVCRAWMGSVQESKYIDFDYLFLKYVKRPQNGLKMLKALIEDDISYVSLLPAPLSDAEPQPPAVLSRTPNANILGCARSDENNKILLDYVVKRLENNDTDDSPSTVGLLREHLVRWKRIKVNWIKHTRAYDEKRYGINFAILDTMFKMQISKS